MKIVVYAICKNESKFVNRWVNSMQEADEIYVLDTGSTDDTKEKLEKLGVIVKTVIIEPFRFDTARNLALEMLPQDTTLCVATNLDEVFNPGWRKELEKNYHGETKVIYNYNSMAYQNNIPINNFYLDRIHTRNDYKWTSPIHEVLTNINQNETKVLISSITLNYYLNDKRKPENYLKLLELRNEEKPNDLNTFYYLGKEYMENNNYQEAILNLTKYLKLSNKIETSKRASAMRFIGRCYRNLEYFDDSIMWYKKSLQEASYIRDSYIELAFLYYELKDYKKMYTYLKQALKIKKPKTNYQNEIFSWNETIYDFLSLACYYLNLIPEGLTYLDMALKINPTNERLKTNKVLMEKVLDTLTK